MLNFISRGTGGNIASDDEVVSAVASGLAVAESVAQSVNDAAASVADSKALSNDVNIDIAGSKADSNNLASSVADSKTISNSINISVADSKAVSVQSGVDVNESIADSKAGSNAINVSVADSKAVSAAGRYSYIEYRILDKDTSHTVDTGVGGEFRVPTAMTISDVGAYFDTAGVGSVTTVDINEGGTSILSTKITVDDGEKTSVTADAAPVISDGSIAADAILTFDVDGIGSGTAGKGLTVWMKVLIG